MQSEFNLIREPWIRVLNPDCSITEVSLKDVLLNADRYVKLAGEMPAQDTAVLRMLLALLYSVFERVDIDGNPRALVTEEQALEFWKELWDRGSLPEKPVTEYLDRYKDRFWLFDAEHPFYQIPLEAFDGKGTTYGSGKLNGAIAESENKPRIFSLRQGEGKEKLTYSEAARWLLYVNSFDDTSSKPTRGKKLPSPGAGWLGKLGLVEAEGRNLFETLMLNFVLLNNGNSLWNIDAAEVKDEYMIKAAWELEKPRTDERVEITEPRMPAALLTIQSRRLCLLTSGGFVTGYKLLGGDFFPKEESSREQMTIWKINEKDSIKSPKRHDPAKQMWREFPSIAIDMKNGTLPGIVMWNRLLKKQKCIPKKYQIRYVISGVVYGDKDFFVKDSIYDSLTFHADLLNDISNSDEGSGWMIRIKHEIECCEKIGSAIQYFSADVYLASGRDSKDNNRAIALRDKEQFYGLLTEPFSRWMASIDPDEDDIDNKSDELRSMVKKAVDTVQKNVISRAGQAGFVGRSVKFTDKKGVEIERHYSSIEASAILHAQIRKIYGEVKE